jgi:hypothetical protein
MCHEQVGIAPIQVHQKFEISAHVILSFLLAQIVAHCLDDPAEPPVA